VDGPEIGGNAGAIEWSGVLPPAVVISISKAALSPEQRGEGEFGTAKLPIAGWRLCKQQAFGMEDTTERGWNRRRFSWTAS
jgi:hypothetical protein